MEEAWDLWLEGVPGHTDHLFEPPGISANGVPAHIQAEARQGVLEIERLSAQVSRPYHAIRRAILANATMALQLEAIGECDENARQALVKGYEPGMDHLLREAVISCSVKWLVLRHYARLKFDDAVPSDWFHQYMHLAKPYVKEKVRLAKDFVLRTDAGAGRFASIYDTLIEELRDRVLKARPKKRFVTPDLPWG